MRIAMIGAKGIATPAIQGGGIERHVELLAERLVRDGHSVTVYVRSYTNPQGRKTWNGVKLRTIRTIRNKFLDTIIYAIFATLDVLRLDVDIVHYHGVGPATLAWIPRLFKRHSKIFATFHSQDKLHEKWGFIARTYLAYGEWAACRFPHKTIAVSHGIQLFCQRMFGRDAMYIPNGVDIPTREPGTSHLKALGLEPNGYFMTLGRLIPLKAHDVAIRAFKELKTDKKLLIIGEPSIYDVEYHVQLQALAKQDPRVVLMGFRSGDELKQLLAHSYCMIHPSRIEGLAIAILEAMSFGKLVVMSDIPANRELVDHSGIAFPVGNVEKLRETLEWLLSDPVLVNVRGERAREAVRKFYSWEYVIRQTEATYQRELEGDHV